MNCRLVKPCSNAKFVIIAEATTSRVCSTSSNARRSLITQLSEFAAFCTQSKAMGARRRIHNRSTSAVGSGGISSRVPKFAMFRIPPALAKRVIRAKAEQEWYFDKWYGAEMKLQERLPTWIGIAIELAARNRGLY